MLGAARLDPRESQGLCLQGLNMEKTLTLLQHQNELILSALERLEQRLDSLERKLGVSPQLPVTAGKKPKVDDSLGLTVEEARKLADIPTTAPNPMAPPPFKSKERWIQELDSIAQVVDSIKDITTPAPPRSRFFRKA